MTIDPLRETQQAFHASTLTELIAKEGLRPGMAAVVDTKE